LWHQPLIMHLPFDIDRLQVSNWTQYGNRDSSVGIATGYGFNGRGVEVQVAVGSRIFSSPRRPDRLWGPTQPPIQWVLGALFPAVKWLWREADHSHPTNAEVKKM
jgi:hypothetical protein